MTASHVTTGFAQINGARLYYEIAGAGHPFVMIHAGIAHSGFWDDQFAFFAREYRVIRYDMRGFGKSLMPDGPFTMRDDLRDLLRFLGIERAYVMGASIGGGIAVDFTLDNPAMVAALIPVVSGLSGSPPPSPDELQQLQRWMAYEAEEEAARAAGDLDRVDAMTVHYWVDGLDRTPEQVDPQVRERVRRMLVENREAEAIEGTNTRPLDPPAAPRLREIAVPTLVIMGDEDEPMVNRACEMIAAGVPGARKVVMHDTAHAPNIERPDEFNRIVRDFLHTLPTT